MLRALICSAALAALIGAGAPLALAQSPAKKPSSPGEMAVAAKILAAKTDRCRRHAREQRLSFFKRRRFVRDCVKDGQ